MSARGYATAAMTSSELMRKAAAKNRYKKAATKGQEAAPEKPSGRGGDRSGPHTNLVAACLSWLKFHNIPAWKNNTGAFHTEGGGFFRASFAGCSDIIGIIPGEGCGRFLAVEVKTGSGELTDKQREFKRLVVSAGGLFIEARSIDDLVDRMQTSEMSIS